MKIEKKHAERLAEYLLSVGWNITDEFRACSKCNNKEDDYSDTKNYCSVCGSKLLPKVIHEDVIDIFVKALEYAICK